MNKNKNKNCTKKKKGKLKKIYKKTRYNNYKKGGSSTVLDQEVLMEAIERAAALDVFKNQLIQEFSYIGLTPRRIRELENLVINGTQDEKADAKGILIYTAKEIINTKIITFHNLITAIRNEKYYNSTYFTQIQTRLINTLIDNIKILGIFKKILNNQNVNYTTQGLYFDFNTYKQNSEEINEILNIQSHQDLIDALNLETLVRGETLRDDFVTRQPGFFVKAKSA